jgi:hypothetical protein
MQLQRRRPQKRWQKKKATEEAAKKKAAEEAATKKKAVEEVAKRKAVEEAATKKKAAKEAVKKPAEDVATVGSGPSLTPSAGVKRMVVPSGSTPPDKWRFLVSWKPRYATQSFICHFLYHICDFNLVSLTYNVPSSNRSPPSGGRGSVAGVAQVIGPQDTIEVQPSDGAAGGGGVPVSGATATTGVAAQVAADDGSPAPEVLPEGDTNVTVEEVATDDPAGLAGPAGGASSSAIAADDGGTVEPEVILGHPTLRAPRDVSLDEAMGTTRWALTQAQNVLHRESGGIIDERRRLLQWTSMIEERTMTERARVEVRQ